MTLREVASQFKARDKIRCKLNMHIESREWFTGTIISIKESGDEWDATIKRDDVLSGNRWGVIITERNKHLIQPILGDWDL